MSDTYTVKKITDLSAKTAGDDTDLYILGNQGTATMRKISFLNLATAVKNKLTSLTFPSLNTSNKTLPGAVNELKSNINVYSSITLTPSTNCGAVSSVTAFKNGNLLFLRFATKPSENIAAGTNLDITLTGVTLQMATDWRLTLGVAGTNTYTCWISNSSSPYTIRCRCMNTQWVTSANVSFSGILLCTS